jgi:hypothetical protein
VRRELGSLSTFMKFLKQPIARRANAEAGVTGHFFEQRFWSAALLSERALLSCMLYVDLNPVRALIAGRIEDIQNAGITERLLQLADGASSLDDYLKPLASGLGEAGGRTLPVTLRSYLRLLETIIDRESRHQEDSPEGRWRKDVASIHRPQRAYGSAQELRDWGGPRNLKRLGSALAA